MTASSLGRALPVLVFCACAPAAQRASLAVTVGAGQPAARQSDANHLITAWAMGRVRLGMTLDEVRRALPRASFARTSDGDGAALVQIAFGRDDSLVVWAEEDDPAAAIDWSKRIVTIESFSAAFHTPEGVHPGSLVSEAIKFFGPVHEITRSEIESRQYITFARQPRALTFRLDYTGVFPSDARRTTRLARGAKIFSIAISSLT